MIGGAKVKLKQNHAYFQFNARTPAKVLLTGFLCLLIACGNSPPPNATIVALKNREPAELITAIEPLLTPSIEYRISGKNIVFYSDGDLSNIVKTLEKLDAPPKEFLVEFRSSQPSSGKRFSTEQHPFITDSLRLIEDTPTEILSTKEILYPFFDEATLIVNSKALMTLKLKTENSSTLHLQLLGKSNTGDTEEIKGAWSIQHRQWQKVSPSIKSGSKNYSTKRKPLDIEVRVTPILEGG